jgi:hypothetical protein
VAASCPEAVHEDDVFIIITLHQNNSPVAVQQQQSSSCVEEGDAEDVEEGKEEGEDDQRFINSPATQTHAKSKKLPVSYYDEWMLMKILKRNLPLSLIKGATIVTSCQNQQQVSIIAVK